MSKSSSSGSGTSITFGCTWLINLIFGAMSVNYILWFWGPLFHLSNTIMNMPFIVKFIIGFFFGHITIPVAIVSWIIHFFWMPGAVTQAASNIDTLQLIGYIAMLF